MPTILSLMAMKLEAVALRIHDRKSQEAMFELLGMEKEDYERDSWIFLRSA